MGVLFPALIGLIMVGLSLTLLMGISLNINWNLYWPIIIILIGVGMLSGRSQRN